MAISTTWDFSPENIRSLLTQRNWNDCAGKASLTESLSRSTRTLRAILSAGLTSFSKRSPETEKPEVSNHWLQVLTGRKDPIHFPESRGYLLSPAPKQMVNPEPQFPCRKKRLISCRMACRRR